MSRPAHVAQERVNTHTFRVGRPFRVACLNPLPGPPLLLRESRSDEGGALDAKSAESRQQHLGPAEHGAVLSSHHKLS